MLNNAGKSTGHSEIWDIVPKIVILIQNYKELAQGRKKRVKERGHRILFATELVTWVLSVIEDKTWFLHLRNL
jgi:hypothetical protein